MPINRRPISSERREKADRQLKEIQRRVDYDTKDYTVELIVNKFNNGDFFVPEYQRDYIWAERNKSSFIESVLLGLPIPFMFLGDCNDGKMEIIDGVQRINTLVAFVEDKLSLQKLPKLIELNGFKFSDLSLPQQRKFFNRSLRIVVLDNETPNELRQDIFSRINRSGKQVNDSEFRRGTYSGALTKFIDRCAKENSFVSICPVTKMQEKRHERFELVLRFFAYVNEYKQFEHDVAPFLDDFLVRNQGSFDKTAFLAEFLGMCHFVEENFPYGFAKSESATITPRVRFEALSVGVALALREKPNLRVNSVDWVASPEFEELTTSDASNNQGKLRKRVEYVRDQLLAGALSE